MKRISSQQTWMVKWFMPFLIVSWLLGALIAVTTASFKTPADAVFIGIAMVVVLVVFGSVYAKLIWPMVDRVDDVGDALVVRRRGVEERIRLSQFINVSEAGRGNPRRIALRLRTPGRFGDEIVFMPPSGFRLPFSRDPIAEDLMVRIDRARREAGA
jgi:hypothetical protein